MRKADGLWRYNMKTWRTFETKQDSFNLLQVWKKSWIDFHVNISDFIKAKWITPRSRSPRGQEFFAFPAEKKLHLRARNFIFHIFFSYLRTYIHIYFLFFLIITFMYIYVYENFIQSFKTHLILELKWYFLWLTGIDCLSACLPWVM